MRMSGSRPRPPAGTSNHHLVIDANKMARLRPLDLEGITSVTILPGITTIGPDAFRGCRGLTSLVLPAGLTRIGDFAFDGCIGLTSLVLPVGVRKIERSAFYGCSGLASLVLPAGVTMIGDSAFRDCTGLTSLALPARLMKIQPDAFYGCRGLTSLVVPAGVTTIESGAFRDCSGLTSLALPAGLRTIASSAFQGCIGLRLVYIMCNNDSEFAALHARMRRHFSQAVEFRFISERVIGDIINRLTFHLPGLPIEHHVPPANLGAVLEGLISGPLSLSKPNALQYTNYHTGQPYRPQIRAYIKNLLVAANRALANQRLPALPPELWWQILSFLFYQRLGPHRFQLLMDSLRTPGHMMQGRGGPIFAALEPAAE